MQVAFVRIGIDSGSGGMHGPLFCNGRFEFIPIPDTFSAGERTYANTSGRYAPRLLDYFPERRRERMADVPLHWDPEFETCTYGNPMTANTRLSCLEQGDLLVFYGGLRGWDFDCPPALYMFGYFVVEHAALARRIAPAELYARYRDNFHVRHPALLTAHFNRLVLVLGGAGSRLLDRAVRISALGENRSGKPLQVLSPEMRDLFGALGGRNSLQRSTARWVQAEYAERAAEFIRSLG